MGTVTKLHKREDMNAMSRFAASARAAVNALCAAMQEADKRGIECLVGFDKDAQGAWFVSRCNIIVRREAEVAPTIIEDVIRFRRLTDTVCDCFNEAESRRINFSFNIDRDDNRVFAVKQCDLMKRL